jgi:hypothetical protein
MFRQEGFSSTKYSGRKDIPTKHFRQEEYFSTKCSGRKDSPVQNDQSVEIFQYTIVSQQGYFSTQY